MTGRETTYDNNRIEKGWVQELGEEKITQEKM